ncbi:MAG: hypothetical protein ACK4N5_07365 [Myxococcales bacterium]
MVFSWLFGEKDKKKDPEQEPGAPDVASLLQQAEEATRARESDRAEALCRRILQLAPGSAEAWTLLGVNLIRRGMSDPELRTEAVLAWTRALALRPDSLRASEHLGVEVEFPDELVSRLVARLADAPPIGEDAATALSRIGGRARAAIRSAAESNGPAAERARQLLATLN